MTTTIDEIRLEASDDQALACAVDTFADRAESFDASAPEANWTAAAILSQFLEVLTASVRAGADAREVWRATAPVRAVCRQSPFIRHAQDWPRGYPGDFEIVEHLISQENRAASGTFGWHLEYLMLSSPAAQQHRNKVAHQRRLIERGLTDRRPGRPVRLLLIASGGAADLREINRCLVGPEDRFVLNDIDADALRFAEDRLGNLAPQCSFVQGNVLHQVDELAAHGTYDLVLAGGLFDYLDAAAATGLVDAALGSLCAPGGLFYFSNIAAGNAFGPMLAYLGGWRLIERDPAAMHALTANHPAELHLQSELTGVTLMGEIRRQS